MTSRKRGRSRVVARAVGLAILALACGTGRHLLAAQQPGGTRPASVTYAVDELAAGAASGAPDRSERYAQLAIWALEAWAGLADPPLRLEATTGSEADIRLHWIGVAGGLYGQTRGRAGEGRGADVFVNIDLEGLGPDIAERVRSDPLFGDAIVYLTCVHELGHAFGLEHTSDFADIMYSFQYGGDFVGYFTRFRNRLRSVADLPGVSPFSASDVRAFLAARR